MSESTSVGLRLDRLSLSSFHRRILVISGLGGLFDGLDTALISFVVAALAVSWRLSNSQVGLLVSSQFAGMAIGGFVAGTVADRWGRKSAFQYTLLLFAIGSLLSALAPGYSSLLACRFVTGLGVGGEVPILMTVVSEFVPPAARGRYLAYMTTLVICGLPLAAAVSLLLIPTAGWRAPFVVGAIPALFVWYVRRRLPESPRWYQSKGRVAEAEAVLRSIEKEAGPAELSAERGEAGRDRTDNGPSGFMDLWTRDLLSRTVMSWVMWFFVILALYGFQSWVPTLLVRRGYTITKSLEFSFLIMSGAVPGTFASSFVVEWFGRKWSMVVTSLVVALVGVGFGNAQNTTQVLVLGWLLAFSIYVLLGEVYVYSPELYPTSIRGAGVGWASAVGRVGSIVGPIAIAEILTRFGVAGVFAFVACGLVLTAVAVGAVGPETKGRRLEELSSSRRATVGSVAN